MSGFLFGGSGSGKDLFARDQIALTNLRLMLQTGIATGALLSGYQWELLTDEWGAASSGESFTSGPPGYYMGVAGVFNFISGATGTNIGDMTGRGGLAAAFDGSSNVAHGSCASSVGASTGWVGKDYGAGSEKAVTRLVVRGSNNIGLVAVAGEAGYSVALQYSSDGSNWITATSLTPGYDASSIAITLDYHGVTAYRYWRCLLTGCGDDQYLAECEFYKDGIPSDMVLKPSAAVSVSSTPDFIVAYLLWRDVGGNAVLADDLAVDLSRDGGTTWSAADVSLAAAYDASYSIIKARADVSAQPTGTSIILRIKTYNGKSQCIAAPAIYAE